MGVAIMMGGGLSSMNGSRAYEALRQFESAASESSVVEKTA